MGIKNRIVLLATLVLGSIIFYFIGGVKFSLIYTMLWIDKIIIGKLKMPLEFGIELFSIPAILVGIIYGPLNGFLFAFFVIPIIGGVLDFIATGLGGTQMLDTGWEPFFPSPESFISGVIAVMAGFLRGSLPFLYIVVGCMVVRFFMHTMKDVIFGMPIVKIPAYLINAGLNIFIAYLFSKFFVLVFLV